jgi:hypothetical protein
MTNLKAQQMVHRARVYLSLSQPCQSYRKLAADRAYQQAWHILFAAENLLSDPTNHHYQRVLASRGGLWTR